LRIGYSGVEDIRKYPDELSDFVTSAKFSPTIAFFWKAMPCNLVCPKYEGSKFH
jgi:hypothetical protein